MAKPLDWRLNWFNRESCGVNQLGWFTYGTPHKTDANYLPRLMRWRRVLSAVTCNLAPNNCRKGSDLRSTSAGCNHSIFFVFSFFCVAVIDVDVVFFASIFFFLFYFFFLFNHYFCFILSVSLFGSLLFSLFLSLFFFLFLFLSMFRSVSLQKCMEINSCIAYQTEMTQDSWGFRAVFSMLSTCIECITHV